MQPLAMQALAHASSCTMHAGPAPRPGPGPGPSHDQENSPSETLISFRIAKKNRSEIMCKEAVESRQDLCSGYDASRMFLFISTFWECDDGDDGEDYDNGRVLGHSQDRYSNAPRE